MTKTLELPVVTVKLDADEVAAQSGSPLQAAMNELYRKLPGWIMYDVERHSRVGELLQFWGTLWDGIMEVYRFYAEITPCLVTVEVYQAEQA